MTNEKAIMCLEDMKIKVPIPKAAKQARENNEALDVAIKALKNEPHWIPATERLPKAKQKVLVQYADGSMAAKRCNDAGHLQWFYANAVAWMPAPEPYREVTE